MDNDIRKSLDYRFGKALSVGECNICNISNHEIDGGCSARDDCGVTNFGRHSIDFGGPNHQSAVGWINNITDEVGITDDAGIKMNTNKILDLARVASLFLIRHSINSNKPLPSNTYNSPTTMHTPAQSKAAIVSAKEDEASFLRGQELRMPLSHLNLNVGQSKLYYCPVSYVLLSIDTHPSPLLFSR
jgi:hypothetical protein